MTCLKNHFPKYWVVASNLDFLVHKKYSLTLLWDENFFSLIKSNGVSKIPSFHTDFKNVHMTLVQVHPKKVLAKELFYQLKIGFLAKTFFGCTFYQGHMYIFEISTKRQIYWCPFQRKKFSSLRRDTELFWELKKVKNGRNCSKCRKTVFYKQILDFHCPSKILWHT